MTSADTAIRALEEHGVASVYVAELACAAISGSIRWDRSDPLSLITRIPLIVRVIVAHMRSVPVCRHALDVLLQLSSSQDSHAPFAAANGMYVMTQVLAAHAANAECSALTCAVVDIMALFVEPRAQLVAVGGVAAITACLARHSSEPKVATWACGALQSICFNNPDACHSVIVLGGVTHVLRVLTKHANSSRVVVQACYALRMILRFDAPITDECIAHVLAVVGMMHDDSTPQNICDEFPRVIEAIAAMCPHAVKRLRRKWDTGPRQIFLQTVVRL